MTLKMTFLRKNKNKKTNEKENILRLIPRMKYSFYITLPNIYSYFTEKKIYYFLFNELAIK